MRLITYNLLCPSYFRCNAFATESARPEVYTRRLLQSVDDLLRSYRPDVLCLQEYPTCGRLGIDVMAQFENTYGYGYVVVPRTSTAAKDGIAIAYRKETLSLQGAYPLELHKASPQYGLSRSDRVSLLLLLRERRRKEDQSSTTPSSSPSSAIETGGNTFGVVTTHLTFAHSKWETKHRAAQMIATVELCQPHCPMDRLVVAGDFNGEKDVVTKYLETLGMKDVNMNNTHTNMVSTSNNNPNGLILQPTSISSSSASSSLSTNFEVVTHVDHNYKPSCADHIFVPYHSVLHKGCLLPENVPADFVFPRPNVGGPCDDEKYFYNRSDHRALLCDVDLPLK